VGRILNPTHEVCLLGDGGVVSLGRCTVASGAMSKVRGLLATERPRSGDGILLRRCSSVHTVGMRFPIDIFFLRALDGIEEGRLSDQERHPYPPLTDEDWCFSVISIIRGVSPWHLPIGRRRATDVLELATGDPSSDERSRVVEGDLVVVRRCEPQARPR
jgi:hypothetical protein